MALFGEAATLLRASSRRTRERRGRTTLRGENGRATHCGRRRRRRPEEMDRDGGREQLCAADHVCGTLVGKGKISIEARAPTTAAAGPRRRAPRAARRRRGTPPRASCSRAQIARAARRASARAFGNGAATRSSARFFDARRDPSDGRRRPQSTAAPHAGAHDRCRAAAQPRALDALRPRLDAPVARRTAHRRGAVRFCVGGGGGRRVPTWLRRASRPTANAARAGVAARPLAPTASARKMSARARSRRGTSWMRRRPAVTARARLDVWQRRHCRASRSSGAPTAIAAACSSTPSSSTRYHTLRMQRLGEHKRQARRPRARRAPRAVRRRRRSTGQGAPAAKPAPPPWYDVEAEANADGGPARPSLRPEVGLERRRRRAASEGQRRGEAGGVGGGACFALFRAAAHAWQSPFARAPPPAGARRSRRRAARATARRAAALAGGWARPRPPATRVWDRSPYRAEDDPLSA